jgi:hypothetical protein
VILIEWLYVVELPSFIKEQIGHQDLYDENEHALSDAKYELLGRYALGHIGGNGQIVNVVRDN